jgi:hypothetical protein
MDLRNSIVSHRHVPSLAIANLSCDDLSVPPELATWDLRVRQAEFAWCASGGSMIEVIRRLNEPASDSHLGMALAVAAVAMGLMLWAIIWQANIIVYQRDLIRVMWTTRFGGMG